ncbi:MAG: phage tail protein [Chloroflexota bacterium]|nr:phage tail protein [Chloroflexota bacterium]
MPTRRPMDHIGKNKFKIEINGVTVAAFTAVEGIEARTAVITYVDGNDMIVRKRPGRTTYSNIIFKRGYVNTDELWQWYKAVMDGQAERRSGSIIVLDEAGDEIFRYNFFEAWPCRWKSLELDAAAPGALIEELEVVVEKIERG